MENRIWLKGDTHLHTCNSDGKLTPGQLVEACQQAGLDYAIITDHNYNTVKASYTDKNLLVMQGQGPPSPSITRFALCAGSTWIWSTSTLTAWKCGTPFSTRIILKI